MYMIPKRQEGSFVDYILPQNGGTEGQMHYGPRASSPRIVTGSSKGSLTGNASSSNTPKRPQKLGVTASNGYASKNLREDMENGSLPSTPEFNSDSEAEEVLEKETTRLVGSFLRDFTGLPKTEGTESSALKTMHRVVTDVLDKHRYAYNGMINKLSLDDRGEDVAFVSAVAKSLFADKTTNWGRIVSLLAFGAVVCQDLKKRGRDNCVELVSQEISAYLLSDQRDWLVKNNAWDGFVEFFRVPDPESMVRNTLMAFAGFAGIGATLALLIR